mmetsp:Transcript_47839/g.95124  ORF Transcript_47839/g.95124 Transcript_47839/m.95124 type:complete len:97 (+) Transcript_47839:152-442(+)
MGPMKHQPNCTQDVVQLSSSLQVSNNERHAYCTGNCQEEKPATCWQLHGSHWMRRGLMTFKAVVASVVDCVTALLLRSTGTSHKKVLCTLNSLAYF